jgi:colicin import membrane protein
MASTFPSLRLKRTSALNRRPEAGRFPAAILALTVHAGFFLLIVFGVSWQVKSPEPAIAELWDKLPPLRNVPEPVVPPAPEPEPPPPPPAQKKAIEPPQPSKAEIQLKAKRDKEALLKKQREDARIEEARKKAEADRKRKEEEARRKVAEAKARAEQEARESQARAVLNAAINDYGQRIGKLIKDRANIPDTVTGRPEVSVRVRLLVNGKVLDAQIIKPSGNRVYDESVERAINGIRQWPLPDNPEILGGRRELNLNITHER